MAIKNKTKSYTFEKTNILIDKKAGYNGHTCVWWLKPIYLHYTKSNIQYKQSYIIFKQLKHKCIWSPFGINLFSWSQCLHVGADSDPDSNAKFTVFPTINEGG